MSTSKCEKCQDKQFIFITDEEGIERVDRCECLLKELEEKRYSKLKEFSAMPKHLRDLKIKDYDTNIYDTAENRAIALKAKRISINYIKNFKTMKESETGLYFYSETKGSGKTRLAIGIGNALMEHLGERVKFTTTAQLLQGIKSTFNGTFNGLNSNDYLNAIKGVSVLIIDDIGTEKLSDWVNETFYDIINQRMLDKLITIYTSNCKPEDLKHDSRIVSRILGSTEPVKCPEEDIRIKLRQGQSDIQKILNS